MTEHIEPIDDEVFWLIERSNLGPRPFWYVEDPYRPDWHSWTPVAVDAMRFSSKAAAEAFPAYQMIAIDPAISITEHVFLRSVRKEREEGDLWPDDPAPIADKAVDHVFKDLAKALGLETWTQQDGSETWEGDVWATMMGILNDAGVIDPETGERAPASPAVTVGVKGLANRLTEEADSRDRHEPEFAPEVTALLREAAAALTSPPGDTAQVEAVAMQVAALDASNRLAAALGVPEPTQEYTLRAMATNYGDGPHKWDFLDKEACAKAADEIHALRAALSTKESPEQLRERCANVGYRICAETRHVTLGDQVAAAIRALPIPASTGERT